MPLLLLALALVSGATWAAETSARYASVVRVQGSVVAAKDAAGQGRELKVGDGVYVGEQVRSSGSGEAVLRTDDAGVIAVRPNAAFVMERFSAQGTQEDSFGLRILSGALRLITGLVGQRNKENYRITTPTATLGVRGTDYEPYVLAGPLAKQFEQREGTYNRVYQGATTMDSNGEELEVSAGQVGFAPSPANSRTRGLMTALMPVLLDKVPSFYVPGVFDADLQAYAAAELARAQRASPAAIPATLPQVARSDKPAAQPTSKAAAPVSTSTAEPDTAQCRFNSIASAWLQELDAAVTRRDPQHFVEMFSPQTVVLAKVNTVQGQSSELRFSRDELARSTFTSLGQLSEFTTRRPAVVARLAQGTTATQCKRLEVESVVIESGVRAGKSYRIESFETFTLERQGKLWKAVTATTTQQ